MPGLRGPQLRPALAEVSAGKFGPSRPSGRSKIDPAGIGGPQPPPGGGPQLLIVACVSPQAASRKRISIGNSFFNCARMAQRGAAADCDRNACRQNRSVRTEPQPPPGGGPQLASARAVPPQAATRKFFPIQFEEPIYFFLENFVTFVAE